MCDTPDTPQADPKIGEAALKNTEIAEKALAWYTDYYDKTLAPMQKELANLNKQVVGQQMGIAQQNADIASEVYDYQKGTFRPIERQMAAEAATYDTEAKREELAGLARADAEAAYQNTAGSVNRDLSRMGVNPSSGRALAIRENMNVQKAAEIAAGMNRARQGAEAIGWAKKADVANLGRGLSSQQATASQLALSGGSQASQVQGSTSANARADGAFVGQGYNTAISGYTSAGNLYATASAQDQAAANSSNQIIGTALGVGGGILASKRLPSDKNIKKNRKPVKSSAAMLAIEGMPIEKWQYDGKKVPSDGREHVGPMAQDFEREVGGDGKTIDLGTGLGVTMAALKDVNKRLKKVESAAQLAAG